MEEEKFDPTSEITETVSNEALVKRDYEQEILELLDGNLPPDELLDKLSDYHESDIAEVLPTLSKEERLKLYKILGNERVSEIFAYLDDVEDFIGELTSEKAADIIEEMDADEAIEVLDELPDEKREEIFELLDKDVKEDIQLIEKYDDDLIGSKMTTNFVFVKKSMPIKQAMKSVVDQAADNDNISTVYVVNDDETFAGAFSLRDLVIARSNQTVDDITVAAYPYVYATEEISKCVEELKDLSEDSIPVLGHDNKIIGVITGSELVDVVDEEFGDDYAKLAGLTKAEDLEEPVFKSVGKRLPWLALLMGLGLIVSSLIGAFEKIVEALPLLVAFQSLILDMSGNGGTQSLAVTIRVISSESLSPKDVFRFVFKEVRVGFTNGTIIGVLATLLCSLYLFVFKPLPYLVCLAYGGCIGTSLLVAMIFSSLGGTLIPMFFKKIRIDPAVASGPLITTINDLVSATIYYTLANVLLLQVMQLGLG
ncbi:MAG: magnesium transporter [Clostridia bacterium]|nr:magnesium transporter [Clostridia bacterium]